METEQGPSQVNHGKMLLVFRSDTFERHFAWNTSEVKSSVFGNSKIVSISDLKILDLYDFDNHSSFFMHNKSWEQNVSDILISDLKNGSIEGINRFGDNVFAKVFITSICDSTGNDFGFFVGRYLLVIYEQLVGSFPIDRTCSSVGARFISILLS